MKGPIPVAVFQDKIEGERVRVMLGDEQATPSLSGRHPILTELITSDGPEG